MDISLEGHSREEYKLVPIALRDEYRLEFWKCSDFTNPLKHQSQSRFMQQLAERAYLRNFYRLADQQGLSVPISESLRNNLITDFFVWNSGKNNIWLPQDLFEIAALAQHYGIPTRLLDWTYDIYIALYFAFHDSLQHDENGCMAIWALNASALRYLSLGMNEVKVEFITPHYASNPNISAQKGVFTLWKEQEATVEGKYLKIDSRSLDRQVMDSLNLYKEKFDLENKLKVVAKNNIFLKLILPRTEAKKGCLLLQRMGYGTARIFPGYDGVAKQILEKHKYS